MPEEIIETPTIDPDTMIPGVEQPPESTSGNPPSEDEGNPPEEAPESQEDDTDWRKRHGDAVRWAQRMASEKAELEAKYRETEARLNKIREAGIELEEFEPSPSQAVPSDYVPKKDFERSVQEVRQELWNTSKMIFQASNPEFKDPDLSRLLDYECSRIAQEEVAQTGNNLLSAEEPLAKGAKHLNKFINKVKSEGQKSAQEKRKKIAETGVVEGHEKPKLPEPEEFSPAEGWVGAQRKTQQRIKAGA